MPKIKFDSKSDRNQWQAIALIAAPILLAMVYGLATGSIPMRGFVFAFAGSMAGVVWYIRAIYFY